MNRQTRSLLMYSCCLLLALGFVGSTALLPKAADVTKMFMGWGYLVGWAVFAALCMGGGVLAGRHDAKVNHTDGVTETCLGAAIGSFAGVCCGFVWPSALWLGFSIYLLFWVLVPWVRRAPVDAKE